MAGPEILTQAVPPPSLIYIAVPNAKDSTTLARLSQVYDVGRERRFESAGYAFSVYLLTQKSSIRP